MKFTAVGGRRLTGGGGFAAAGMDGVGCAAVGCEANGSPHIGIALGMAIAGLFLRLPRVDERTWLICIASFCMVKAMVGNSGNRMRNKTNKRAGFTLVEIMIVVAIIGMLAAIAIPNFVRARTTSQMNACINNLRLIDSAKQQWALEQHCPGSAFPATSGSDLQPYLGHGSAGELPSCPADPAAAWDSSYGPWIENVSTKPECGVVPLTHILP